MADMNLNNPPATVKTLADRMKWARELKGWSQPHLALAAEVSTSTVGMVESGARQNKGSLPQLAIALGVRHRWLLHGELPVTEDTEVVLPEPDLELPEGKRVEFKARAPIIRPQPMGDGVERRLTRFLAVLFQLPEAERDRALVAATEVLLDHLPPPPSA